MTNKKSWNILVGDCRERLKDLEDESVHMIWTSPPYFGLRDYGEEDQIGLEPTPQEFVEALTEVMREAKRVLRDDGTLWLNLGDCYAQKKGHGHWTSSSDKGYENGQKVTKGWADRGAKDIGLKPQDLIGIPWRAAFSLQSDGWYLRSDIIWAKGISGQDDIAQRVYEVAINNGVDPKVATKMMKDLDLYAGNPMPESVRSRPSSAHEHLFLFSKSRKYFYDHIAAKEASVSDHPSGNGFKRKARLSYKDEDGARGNEDQWEMTPKRNLRNVWCIPTKPFREAHFATAPEALVKKCVEIGTSEGGCCPICEAPIKRVVKIQSSANQENYSGSDQHGSDNRRMMRNGQFHSSSATIGWESTCSCESSEPIPCKVLDPFMGAATTLLVADKLGRKGVGIELNPEYVEIAEKRLEDSRRERFDQWDDNYIPLESDDELPDEIELSDIFGK